MAIAIDWYRCRPKPGQNAYVYKAYVYKVKVELLLNQCAGLLNTGEIIHLTA